VLSMATGADGASRTGEVRLIGSAKHFGVEAQDAQQWLLTTAKLVAELWEPMLREVAAPIMADSAMLDGLISDARAAFSYSEWLCA
jgi:serine/threonine-protein kinase HipA